METGDVLYHTHRYLEAYEHYARVHEGGWSSPRMLLKMASIQEGMGHYPEALYFLAQHYHITHDTHVRRKIHSIAAAQSLRGYVFGHADFFARWWHRCRSVLTTTGLLLCLILLAIILYRRFAGKKAIHIAPYFFLSMMCSACLIAGDVVLRQPCAIPWQKALVVSEPSSAADQLGLLQQGERVVVRERTPIWTKIRYHHTQKDRREGYVRTKALLFLR